MKKITEFYIQDAGAGDGRICFESFYKWHIDRLRRLWVNGDLFRTSIGDFIHRPEFDDPWMADYGMSFDVRFPENYTDEDKERDWDSFVEEFCELMNCSEDCFAYGRGLFI